MTLVCVKGLAVIFHVPEKVLVAWSREGRDVSGRIYPAISAFSLLSSLGGSTGSKTLCMPGEGESRGSSPRFNIFFLFFFSHPFILCG